MKVELVDDRVTYTITHEEPYGTVKARGRYLSTGEVLETLERAQDVDDPDLWDPKEDGVGISSAAWLALEDMRLQNRINQFLKTRMDGGVELRNLGFDDSSNHRKVWENEHHTKVAVGMPMKKVPSGVSVTIQFLWRSPSGFWWVIYRDEFGSDRRAMAKFFED